KATAFRPPFNRCRATQPRPACRYSPEPQCPMPLAGGWSDAAQFHPTRTRRAAPATHRIHGRIFMTRKALYSSVAALALVAFLTAASAPSRAQQADSAIQVGAAGLGGGVTGAGGPEAGVWVIAETTDLGTKLTKIVVTDDRGRYLIPELPKANYNVWVRGYGLVDSPKVQGAPGKTLNLTAVKAPNEAAAAEYYPGMYWYSMLRIPAASEFPGTGPKGNGIPPFIKSQHAWIDTVKNACQSCHAIGSHGVRRISSKLGE